MAKINFQGEWLPHSPVDTVLDSLLQAGQTIPYGCRSGACQSCLLEMAVGSPPAAAQEGLTSAQVKRQLFLSCQCYLAEDVSVSLPSEHTPNFSARVLAKQYLNPQVIQLRLALDAPFKYDAGQYVRLSGNGVTRSYSLASSPKQDDFLEFHIKRHPEGCFSSWVFDHLNEGDSLQVEGPKGDFILHDTVKPLLLVANSTGLAPIYGILQQIMYQNFKQEVTLVLAVRNLNDFYLLERLCRISESLDNLHVVGTYLEAFNGSESTVVPHKNNPERIKLHHTDVYTFIKSLRSNLSGYQVYISGSLSLVNRLSKQCFFQGAARASIFTDGFCAS